jgi:putative endonuclease
VVVEVKTRTSKAYGVPELAMDRRKQEHIIKAERDYLKYKNLHQMPCRFDVVVIRGADGDKVELIRNVFEIDRRTF